MPPVRTPQDMLKIAFEKLTLRTGRDKDGWVEVARQSGISTHKALTDWLKVTHGLNHNEAQWVAWGVTDPTRLDQYERPADLVAELYSGKRAPMLPVYERLMAAGLALGPDVTSFVCKGYTSLSVGTQFVIFVPRVIGAVDVELVLPADSPVGEPFTGSNPKFTRRIRLRSVDEVSPEVIAAMAQARRFIQG